MSGRYAHGWRHVWLAWAAVTLSVAAALWSLPAVLLLVGTGAVLITMVTGLVRSGAGQSEETISPRRLAADGLRWGVLATAVTVTGMVQVGLGFLLAVAMVVSSAPVVRLFLGAGRAPGRRTSHEVSTALHELDLRRAGEVVQRLDLPGLCWAWSRSADLLVEVPQAEARAAVVALRELYLDEMERRDPAGFASWLDAGAGSSGSPERFLAGPDDPRSGGVAA